MAKGWNKADTAKLMQRLVYGLLVLGAVSLIGRAIDRKKGRYVQGEPVIQIVPLADGEYLIQPEDVLVLLERSFTQRIDAMQVSEVDVRRIEEVLERDPFILDADAFINARDEVYIHLSQREPLLRVMDNTDNDYYLDHTGERMPPSKHHAARVLVATGNVQPWTDDYRTKAEHDLNHLIALANRLRADDFLEALVEQVYLNNKGEMVLAPKVGDQIILLGRYDPERIDRQLQRLKDFYREGLPYRGWRAYRSFDLRYEDQVVAKKR
jgi:cell division protein FtsQ